MIPLNYGGGKNILVMGEKYFRDWVVKFGGAKVTKKIKGYGGKYIFREWQIFL